MKRQNFTPIGLILILSIVFCASCGSKKYVAKMTDPSVKSADDVDEIYYSDYFSFQGEDEKGVVLLAVDNNRWKGEKYGIDHYTVMYDKGQWIPMKGNRKNFDNPSKKVAQIPNDEIYTFEGTPETGMTITSEANGFTLKIEPLVVTNKNEKGFAQFTMLSAAGTLIWKGKQIKGRVIEEYLVLPCFSKRKSEFLKLSGGGKPTLNCLYLAVEGGGDLYFHSSNPRSGGMEFISGNNLGFLHLNKGNSYPFYKGKVLNISRSDRKLFYKYPMDYNISLSDNAPNAQLNIKTIERKGVRSFLLAGFSMAYIEGTLEIDGKKYRVFGLGELID